jgi:hypothetical protein
MFDKYSYKVKFYALIAVFALLSITAYKRSFSTLLRLIAENKELVAKAEMASNGLKDFKQIKADLAVIDKVIGRDGVHKETVQQEIISFVSNYRHVSIHDVQAIHEYTEKGIVAYTNQLDVTGATEPLLALVYDFEKKFLYSRLVNMKFYTVKKDNKESVLHLKMIFQNYEKNN